MINHTERKRITENMYNTCMESGCTCGKEDAINWATTEEERATLDRDDIEAMWARACTRAAGEYIANYFETPDRDELTISPGEYTLWLNEMLEDSVS